MIKDLADIWKEILDLDEAPGEEDSFFELGGNSFLAAQVIMEIENKLNKTIEIADFYENETLKEMAEFLEEASDG